jgi:hypothetical protein
MNSGATFSLPDECFDGEHSECVFWLCLASFLFLYFFTLVVIDLLFPLLQLKEVEA